MARFGTRAMRFRDDIGVGEIHLFNRNPSPADGVVWCGVGPGGRLAVRTRVAVVSRRVLPFAPIVAIG